MYGGATGSGPARKTRLRFHTGNGGGGDMDSPPSGNPPAPNGEDTPSNTDASISSGYEVDADEDSASAWTYGSLQISSILAFTGMVSFWLL